MKKSEIIERLTELRDSLDMDSDKYAEQHNNKYPESRALKSEETWAYRVGVAISEINWILEH